jgi:hypothetical protein
VTKKAKSRAFRKFSEADASPELTTRRALEVTDVELAVVDPRVIASEKVDTKLLSK